MAAVDVFTGIPGMSLDHPYTGGAAVTPHDTNELAQVTRGLYVGGAGNLKVTTQDGTDLTFNSVPVGFHRLRVKKVFSTDTTATNIVAVW